MSAGELAAGLHEIARRRTASGAGRPPFPRPALPDERPREAPGFDAAAPPRAGSAGLPGAEWLEVGGERVLCLVEDADGFDGVQLSGELAAALGRIASMEEDDVAPGLLAARGHRLADLAVLDLETTGFWGCPLFLVGLLLEERGRLVTRQILARDYPEEEAVVRAAARVLAGRRLLVTFNGKSYDVPCLRERAVVHRVEHRLGTLDHVDVLHPARRRFRHELPDCRLVTLEREVVGIFRTGDVPSWQVPAVYHEFAATGDIARLLPVLHHSRIDLLTTARLFVELAR